MAHQHSFSQDVGPLGLLTGEQRMSRRTILQRLAGLTLAGGSITSFVASCSSSTHSPSASRTFFTSISIKTALYTYRGHSAGVIGVAWSPDGTRIASGSDDHTVQVWDAASGGHVYTYRGHADAVLGVAWSPDNKRIVSGGGNVDNGRGDTIAQVWDAANGGHVYTYRGHSLPIWTVAWSPDGTRLASGSWDKTVQVWQAP